MKKIFFFFFLFSFFFFNNSFSQQINVRGIIFDKDSVTPMSYAYIVNKNSTTGTVADESGKFFIAVKLGDTLSFSYLGYSVTKLFTGTMKDSIKNSYLSVKIFLRPKVSELKTAVIGTYKMSNAQKQMYETKIDDYKRTVSSLLESNSTGAGLNLDALYYMFSKKGKELQQLSVLYQQLLIEEVKEKRLSDEVVRKITGNDTLNVKDFLSNCFLPDEFIVHASDYDLYSAVHKCYLDYMEAHRRKKK